MKELKKCINCKKVFFIYTSSVAGRGKYCSRSCKAIYAKEHSGSTRICPVCKIKFYAKGNPTARIFCSLFCSGKYRKTGEVVKCLFCSKEVYKPKNQLDRAKNSFCSQGCANRYQEQTDDKEGMKANGTKSILSQLKKKGFNKLELSGRKILQDLGIDFQEQVPMYGKFIVDILIEDKKIVIQWDGEYWHSKPTAKQRDNSQDKYLEKCGYKVLRYTDKQMKNEIDLVIKDIKVKCNP